MMNNIVQSDLAYITAKDLPWEAFDNKTILVTGAAGFLPAYMVETLLYLNKTRAYNIRVIGLVRNLDAAQKRFSYYEGDPNLKLFSQDVCDPIAIADDIDYIVHAASQATPKLFSSDPVGTILPNVQGTNNLLRLAADKKAEGFLFFSTSGVYGHVPPDSYPIKEDYYGYIDPMDIASCYIESKRMGENLCVAWMHQHGVPIKIIRPSITYGPGVRLNDGRSFADFINNILNAQDIELYSEGRVLRNFCYLADATAGFFTVLLKGLAGEAYNVANDHEISIIDLARLLVNEAFPELNLKVVMKTDASKNFLRMDFPRTAVDITKAKALGWNIHFSEKEGFRRTVESFLPHGGT